MNKKKKKKKKDLLPPFRMGPFAGGYLLFVAPLLWQNPVSSLEEKNLQGHIKLPKKS